MKDAVQLHGVETDAAVIAGLAFSAQNPTERSVSTAIGKAILLRNEDGTESLELVEELAAAAATTGRIVQAVTVETQESLVTYAKRYQGESSLILASIKANEIKAVLDYHQARTTADGEVLARDGMTHQFGGHVATLALPFSLEWIEWTGVDGKLLPQLEFCRFLEECAEDILSPDAATVIEACRDLQSLTKVDFRSVVRADSENYKIEYFNEDTVTTKNEAVSLPSEIVLSLPVYFGGAEVEVRALIRWKVDGGKLSLGVKLKRAERIRQETFKAIVEEIASDTGFPRVYGSLASR